MTHTVMIVTACRECGKNTSPEYADDHNGLCIVCYWPPAAPGISGEVFVPDPIRDAIDRACVEWCRDADTVYRARREGKAQDMLNGQDLSTDAEGA